MADGVRALWQWMRNRFDYIRFKMVQDRYKRKAREEDPDIYPLW